MSNNTSRTNHTTSKELKARITRASFLEKYQTAQNDTGQNSCDSYFIANISSILEELETVATCDSNESENIVQLQLSDIVDKFIRKLEPHEQIIYTRRYFYADTIENIAASCDLSADKIRTIIKKSNESLNSTLKEKNCLTNTSSLFQCFTDIQDDLITFGSDIENINNYLHSKSNKSVKKLNVHLNKYTVTFAAVFAIAIIIILSIIPSGDGTQTKPESNVSNDVENDSKNDVENDSENGTSNHVPINIDDYKHIFDEDEDGTYVITQELMKYEEINPRLQQSTDFNRNNCKLSYYPHKLTIDTDILKYCLGTLNEDFSNETTKYYTLLGHKDFYYLIQEQDGLYTLYRLYQVQPTGFYKSNTFEKNLKELYGIENADDIEKILIAPMNMDIYFNFEPETLFCVDDYDSIANTYLNLKNMEYTDKTMYEPLPGEKLSFSLLNDVSMRFIIYTKKGGLITNLCYNFSNHYFYDSYGTRFSIISEDASQTLDDIYKFSDVFKNATVWDPEVHKISISVQDVISTRIGLVYQNHGEPIDGLYISSQFELEQLIDGVWHTVEPKEEPSADQTFDIFNNSIPSFGTTLCTFYFNSTYGRLPAGKYRIITSVCNFFTYNTDNHVQQLYYTEFEIK